MKSLILKRDTVPLSKLKDKEGVLILQYQEPNHLFDISRSDNIKLDELRFVLCSILRENINKSNRLK